MYNDYKYDNGELLTAYRNCYELTYTIDQIVEYGDYDIHTMYFYNYEYDYHIHYDIERGKLYLIYNGDNETHDTIIHWYWNDETIASLQTLIKTSINTDEIIRHILYFMDNFSIIFKDSNDERKKVIVKYFNKHQSNESEDCLNV